MCSFKKSRVNIFMSPAFVFYGIDCCVTHLYFRNGIGQIQTEEAQGRREITLRLSVSAVNGC